MLNIAVDIISGTKIKYRKRCELCTFVDIDLITDKLLCTKQNYLVVDDNHLCSEFKLDKQVRKDILDGLMSKGL